MESLCSLQSEEALRRPSTADGQGEERPYTQAGSWADDRVGLVVRGAAWGGNGDGTPDRFLLLTQSRAGGMKMDAP